MNCSTRTHRDVLTTVAGFNADFNLASESGDCLIGEFEHVRLLKGHGKILCVVGRLHYVTVDAAAE